MRAVWALRGCLANAAVTSAKIVDRSVFALTGFGVARWWSGVVQRLACPLTLDIVPRSCSLEDRARIIIR